LSEIERLKKLGYTEAEAQAWIENYLLNGKNGTKLIDEVKEKVKPFQRGNRYIFPHDSFWYFVGLRIRVFDPSITHVP